jgi:putative ABC transport system ATP-binding protein
VIDSILAIHREIGLTLIVVTHDAQVANRFGRTVTIRDGRVGAEGRCGVEYAVVGRDGSLHLPPQVLDLLPPDSLVRVIRLDDGVELRRVDDEDLTP